jgi:hypothetical protein
MPFIHEFVGLRDMMFARDALSTIFRTGVGRGRTGMRGTSPGDLDKNNPNLKQM